MSYEEIDAAIERLRVTNQLIGPAFANCWWPLGTGGRQVASSLYQESLELDAQAG
jgi:hypothetical protein